MWAPVELFLAPMLSVHASQERVYGAALVLEKLIVWGCFNYGIVCWNYWVTERWKVDAL